MASIAPPEGIQQTLARSFEDVVKVQQKLQETMQMLEARVVTKETLEEIINNRVMTKQDFAAQRAKDDLIFQHVMKERVTKRMLYTAVSGFGCLYALLSGFFILLIGIGIFLLLHFLPG